MPYLMVMYVDLRDDVPQADREQMLREVVVPRVQALPGFRSARYSRSLDGTTGVAAVTFDSEVDAKAALDVMSTNRPPGSPPVLDTAIYEVFLEV